MGVVDLLVHYKGTPVRLEFVDGEIIDAQFPTSTPMTIET